MVSVIVLTGFLGSGKTSLLNRLLDQRPSGRGRMAILVNELGDVGIDGSLLPPGMSRQVELPGGCICCELNEDLDRTLHELIDAQPDLETIVVETTGVAEPLPITWTLARPPLSERLRLAAVVAVVDPLHHLQHRTMSPAVDAQVEYADLLVLSKLDLTPEGRAPEEVMSAIRSLNPDAPILAEPPEETPALLWRLLADPDAGGRSSARSAADAGAHAPHSHPEHRFDTVWAPIDKLLDFEELADALEELPANYVRIKGIARVVDRSTGSSEPHMIAFHRVGTRVSSEPITADGPMRIVALGPEVEVEPLTACLRAAVIG